MRREISTSCSEDESHPHVQRQELHVEVGPFLQPITWPDAQLKSSGWHQCEKDNWPIFRDFQESYLSWHDFVMHMDFWAWPVRSHNSCANEHTLSEFREYADHYTMPWTDNALGRWCQGASNCLCLEQKPSLKLHPNHTLSLPWIPTAWTTSSHKEPTRMWVLKKPSSMFRYSFKREPVRGGQSADSLQS